MAPHHALLAMGEVEATVSMTGTATHIACNMLGMGCLQLPWALAIGGWLAIPWLILVATMAAYTASVLGSLVAESGLSHYADLIELKLGHRGRLAAFIIQNCSLILVSAAMLVLAATNLQTQWPRIFRNPNLGLLLCAVAAAPLCRVRDFGILKSSSILGIGGALFTTLFIIYLLVQDGPASADDTHLSLLDMQGFPVASSSFVLVFGGHASLPTIFGAMRDPTQQKQSIRMAWFCALAIDAVVMVAAFLRFGRSLQSPILLSLPSGPIRSTCLLLITVHCWATIPLLLSPLAFNVERGLQKRQPVSERCANFAAALIRIGLLLGVCLVGACLPFFSDLISIQGAVFGTLTVFTLPVLTKLVGRDADAGVLE